MLTMPSHKASGPAAIVDLYGMMHVNIFTSSEMRFIIHR